MISICGKALTDPSQEAIVGGKMLLTELMNIDLKSKAENRQIRNIDFTKQLKAKESMGLEEL